jgi:pimeloyl-ACP methyl ester carboxylesterase
MPGAMNEQFCDVGRGVTLCYETFGDPEDPPLLLVMGLSTQMIGWPESFCRQLADRGFYVVRFDNRDVGRSTHLDFRAPSTGQLIRRRFGPEQYDLGDMAEDANGLLRELGLAPAHVVGISMGGMIAQTLAVRHPEAVRSLVSMNSTTGSRRKGQPHPLVYSAFLRKRPEDPEDVERYMVSLFKIIGSPPPNQDLDLIRERVRQSLERDRDRFGSGRQLGAVLSSGNRTAELRRITAPTLVIHGDKDRMINPSGGRATAAAIPGAKLMMIEGYGHDLFRHWWPRLLEAISEHAHGADEAGREPASALTDSAR